jgi:phosphoribosylformylglycinamidine synthase
LRQEVTFVWHKEGSLGDLELIVLPGGFSYGDYLRTGAVARFSPIMKDVIAQANKGKPVIGICNGFQILLEAGLLPGAMLRNRGLAFVCDSVTLRVENEDSIFTRKVKKGSLLRLPIAHGEGSYHCDEETLDTLQEQGRILFRYVSPDGAALDLYNPNGSVDNIAGITNEAGNVLGMMPHPERASEEILGSSDGRFIWGSLLETVGAS